MVSFALVWSGLVLPWAQSPSHPQQVGTRSSVRTPGEASLTPRPPAARREGRQRPAGTGRGVDNEVHLPRPEDRGVPNTFASPLASSRPHPHSPGDSEEDLGPPGPVWRAAWSPPRSPKRLRACPGLHLRTAPNGCHARGRPGRGKPHVRPRSRGPAPFPAQRYQAHARHCRPSCPSVGPDPTVDTSRSCPVHPDNPPLMPGT